MLTELITCAAGPAKHAASFAHKSAHSILHGSGKGWDIPPTGKSVPCRKTTWNAEHIRRIPRRTTGSRRQEVQTTRLSALALRLIKLLSPGCRRAQHHTALWCAGREYPATESGPCQYSGRLRHEQVRMGDIQTWFRARMALVSLVSRAARHSGDKTVKEPHPYTVPVTLDARNLPGPSGRAFPTAAGRALPT
jgi:hypothetical protein